MGAMRACTVTEDASFLAEKGALCAKYPAINTAVEDLKEALQLDYAVPEFPVDPDGLPGVYAIRLDYPPLGSAGRGRFLITYHATDPAPSMTNPYRRFTLLTVTERP